MRPFLAAAVVRARGAMARRVPASRRRALAAAGSPGALAPALAALGYGPGSAAGEAGEGSPLAEAIDRGLRRGAAARLRRVVDWIQDAGAIADALFQEEDRRSLRALLRGAAAGASREARLRGTVETPGLPAALLERVAAAPDLAACTRALVRSGHPVGDALRGLADAGLRELDAAVAGALAARARHAARPGDAALREWVAEGIDVENAWRALAGAEADAFLPGGSRLGPAALVAAAGAEAPEARRRLARALAGSPLAEVFETASDGDPRLEGRVLVARHAAWQRRARREPLGSAPLVRCVLALRLELADLRRIHWGVEQGLAPEAIVAELLEAA